MKNHSASSTLGRFLIKEKEQETANEHFCISKCFAANALSLCAWLSLKKGVCVWGGGYFIRA